MRYLPAILLIGATLIPVGCNSDLRCRRETALLRAEYLDLEDKYYALLAQGPDSTVIVDNGQQGVSNYAPATIRESGIVTQQPAGQPIFNGGPINGGLVNGGPINGFPINGSPVNSSPEIIYYDEGPTYQGVPGQIFSGGTVIGNGIISEGTVINSPTLASPVLQDSRESFDVPTPAESGSGSRMAPYQEDYDNDSNMETSPLPQPSSSDPSLEDEAGTSILEMDTERLTFDFASQSSVSGSENERVSSIRINTSVSHGEAVDSVPGDDKLKLLLQPLNGSGAVMEQAGNLSISVIDEQADQGEQQIGYWEFVRSEAELFFARDEFDNRGILLELPWEDKIPTHSNLSVYIRFETVDGRVLDTTEIVTIDPPKSASRQDDIVEAAPELEQSDWYQSQSRSRKKSSRKRTNSPDKDSRIETRPINQASQSDSGDDSYYRRPAWKPVR